MQKFKKILKALLICLAAVCAFALLRDAFILCLLKGENFEKRGTDIAEISSLFPAKIVPEEISDFSYAHKKREGNSSIFWKGRINKNSLEKFVKDRALKKVQDPPIYDYLIKDELGVKIYNPCEVYESRGSHLTYIYDASEQLFGIYFSK